MRILPILFSAPMVLALLAGTKQQTRRIIKCDGIENVLNFVKTGTDELSRDIYSMEAIVTHSAPVIRNHSWSPRIAVGDRLYVKETVRAEERRQDGLDGVRYLADQEFIPIENTKHAAEKWCGLFAIYGKRGATAPSIFMPRWASRITLDVTDVRVERLLDITDADAIAEGIEKQPYTGDDPQYAGMFAWKDYSSHPHSVAGFRDDRPVLSYQSLWTKINGAGSWEANPWVTVYCFTVTKQNVDRIAA